MSDPLYVQCRPSDLKEVIGQEAAVKSLLALFKKGKSMPHAFLFSGPSGIGKTTIARILARMLGAEDSGILELDAATNSGIADMRMVVDVSRYKSVAASGVKVVIVDECHALSKATWQSLLKATEEPPSHVYWIFCTTELDKVPATIISRCTAFALKPPAWEEIQEILESVVEEKELDVTEEIIGLCARQCHGNVRKALVFLDQCVGIESKKEALSLMAGVANEAEAIELARMVCSRKGATWKAAVVLLKKLENDNPEGIRLVVVNYAAKMLMDPGTKPEPLLAVLDAFRGPYNQSERFGPLMLSLGTLLLE